MFDIAKKDMIVQLQTSNEWDGCWGIIERITNNIIYIFSIYKPWHRYEIHRNWNEREMVLYPDVNKLR